MRAMTVLACGAALAASAGPSAGQAPEARQVFSVTVQGTGEVRKRQDLPPGVAFAVTSDALVTAPRVIGPSRNFRYDPQFGEGGVPARTIGLQDLGDDSSTPTVVPAGVRSSGGRVAVLVPGGQPLPLAPLPLSACALKDGDYRVLAGGDGSAAPVLLRPVFVNGAVTHFTVRSPTGGWKAAQEALGAPVLDAEGRVAGVLTDAAADGLNVEVTPLSEVTDLLPAGAALACDPRVNAEAFADMQREVQTLARRVAAAEETGRLALSVLADVGADLERYLEASRLGGDTQTPLESMRARLKSSELLVPTVSKIDAYLRQPAWTARAKFDGERLQLTFTYRTQLPGSRVSESLTLCMRLIKPFQSDEPGNYDFRSPHFYAAAMRADPGRLVWCILVTAANPADRTQVGAYKIEVSRAALEEMYADYRRRNDWLPPVWDGLAYTTLIAPNGDTTAGEGQGQQARDEVILRALVVVPPVAGNQPGVVPAQCVLFENDQSVIDFLSQRAPRSAGATLDDISGLVIDPQNTSDECVPASAQ